MPPRLRIRSVARLTDPSLRRNAFICLRCQYATVVTSTPAPATPQMIDSIPSMQRYSPVSPPSHRDPKYRKSQLLRSYVSLLQTTPLIILYQHNNLKASEWVGVRRELANALAKVDSQMQAQNTSPENIIGDKVKISVIRTNIFEPALRITEYFNPSEMTGELIESQGIDSERADPSLTHALSETAYQAVKDKKGQHLLSPLLIGPIAALTFPKISPQHIKAALSILSPKAPLYPAPTRRANPSYHEPAVQDGLKKLMLLGARIDGEVFDIEGTRWVGSIDGGIDGLRAQLVAMLQGFGAGVTNTLESASRSLYFTMESRRVMLDEESKPKEEEKPEI